MSVFDPEPRMGRMRNPRRASKAVIPSYIGDEGLVANYLFRSGGGTKVYDHSAKRNHGDFENNPEWMDGVYGWCVDFDRADEDRISVPDDPSLDLTDAVTVLAWVNADEFVDWESVVTKSIGTGYCWRLYVESGPGIRAQLQDTAVNYPGGDVAADLVIGEWEQIGFTYEVTDPASDITVYHDGESVGTLAGTTNDIITSNDPLYLGIQNPTNPHALNGQEAWVLVYNRKLSGTEVNQFYENTRILFGV